MFNKVGNRLLPLFFISVFVCCNKAPEFNSSNDQFQKWKKLGIYNYAFTLRVNCFCPIETVGPHKIIVVNNQIQSVNGQSYDPGKHTFVKTIDELFEVIRINLEKKPYRKTLEYDDRYYFPSNIYFDLSEMIADEEIGYLVTEFQPK